jgi:hypothetical protein
MSAKTRTRGYVDLPLKPGDYIVAMSEAESGENDGELIVTTKAGRTFAVRQVTRYKRPFKVRELK